MIKYICAALILFSLFSCSQEAGEGGSSSIMGAIWIEDYNSNGILIDEYPAQEERVYIVYNAEGIFDDDIRTNYDGSYKFEYLRKGDYQIFAYSDCDACPGGQEAIIVDVKISERRQTVEVPLITLRK